MSDSVVLTHITTVPVSLFFLKGQVGYMKDRGLEIHVISSPGRLLDDFASAHQVSAHAVEMERRITPIRDLIAIWRLVRTLGSTKPTIVHAHTPKGGLLGMISSRLVRAPIRVYHIRGLPYMAATGRRRMLLKTTELVACMLADRVFCVSHSIRDVAIRDGLCPEDKIMVFAGGSGNGVDADVHFNPERFTADELMAMRQRWAIPEIATIILFVGRIVRDKGVEELAAAWEVIRAMHPEAHLVMVGPREPQDPVSQEAMTRLSEDDHVTMTGEADDPAIYYAMADLVVLPTYREGFPNVLLEASAMARPIVATRIPGCIDAVDDGVTGTLVPSRDARALCTAIDAYLANPGLREAHGVAGRTRVMCEFRQEIVWEAMYEEYGRLLKSAEMRSFGRKQMKTGHAE